MRYLLCILLPPLAVMTTGRLGSTILNVLLTCCFWLPGMIHAFAVVNDWKQDKRVEQLARLSRQTPFGEYRKDKVRR